MGLRRGAAVAALVLLADQLTKLAVVARLPFGAEQPVIPGLLNLVHTRNRGVAFGLLASAGEGVQLALLVLVVAVIVVVARQLHASGHDGLGGVGLALVLGGALGNLTDRLVRGEVVDFLDVYLAWGGRTHHWPAFNVADACISVGAALVVLAELRGGGRAGRAPDPD